MNLFLFLGGPNGSNGFTAVGLHATGGSQINNGQPLPIQSIKPIQAVQPQIHNTGIPIQQVSIAPNMTSSSHMMGSAAPPSGVIMNLNPRGGNGVSFTPQGRQGYAQMGHNSGSMDNISLNSTLSSNLSIGSSMSTGKFVLFFICQGSLEIRYINILFRDVTVGKFLVERTISDWVQKKTGKFL